jgi:5-methylcytosine-specific restriction endonuclease McrA
MSNQSIPPTKRCTKCGNEYLATTEYFHRSKLGKYGLRSTCRQCRIIVSKREQLPDGLKRCPACKEIKPFTQEFYSKDITKKNQLRSLCKFCEAEKIRRWRKENPALSRERGRECAKRRRLKDPRKARDQQRATEVRHPDTVRQRKDRYNKSKHGRLIRRAGYKRYIARKMNASGTHTAVDIQSQYNRQKGRCYYCKTRLNNVYEVDHVIPLSRGGSNSPDNIVIACGPCNKHKSSKMPHEWGNGGKLC